jgi:hypothetical protein
MVGHNDNNSGKASGRRLLILVWLVVLPICVFLIGRYILANPPITNRDLIAVNAVILAWIVLGYFVFRTPKRRRRRPYND